MSGETGGADDLADGGEIQRLIDLMARLPGLGPRSARRAVFALVKRREALLRPLAAALADVAAHAQLCRECGNLDTAPICALCRDPTRDQGMLCVVEEVGDLWAMERGGAFRGRYHVLGGVLSALDGVGPEALGIPRLAQRAAGARGGPGAERHRRWRDHGALHRRHAGAAGCHGHVACAGRAGRRRARLSRRRHDKRGAAGAPGAVRGDAASAKLFSTMSLLRRNRCCHPRRISL